LDNHKPLKYSVTVLAWVKPSVIRLGVGTVGTIVACCGAIATSRVLRLIPRSIIVTSIAHINILGTGCAGIVSSREGTPDWLVQVHRSEPLLDVLNCEKINFSLGPDDRKRISDTKLKRSWLLMGSVTWERI
jgi:hypothetical protein